MKGWGVPEQRSQAGTRSQLPCSDDTVGLGIILQQGADLVDIAGPAGVFHCAGRHFAWIGASDKVTYQLDYLSPDGGMVRTRQELVIETSTQSGHSDLVSAEF